MNAEAVRREQDEAEELQTYLERLQEAVRGAGDAHSRKRDHQY